MIFEKIRERLELYRFDIQKVVSKVLEKYGFPYDSVVQDEIHYELDNFFENKDTINIINQVEAGYNNGWIPCSVRLPDVEADVLLSLRSLDIYTGFRANTEGCFYVEGEGYVEYDNVLAWQPLPEPYTPKGE